MLWKPRRRQLLWFMHILGAVRPPPLPRLPMIQIQLIEEELKLTSLSITNKMRFSTVRQSLRSNNKDLFTGPAQPNPAVACQHYILQGARVSVSQDEFFNARARRGKRRKERSVLVPRIISNCLLFIPGHPFVFSLFEYLSTFAERYSSQWNCILSMQSHRSLPYRIVRNSCLKPGTFPV